MWAALRTCPHLHRPYDYDYDDEDHLATYTLDGTHTREDHLPDNRYNILIAYLRIISLFNVISVRVCSIFRLHAPGEGALLEDSRPRVYFRPRKPCRRASTASGAVTSVRIASRSTLRPPSK